MPTQEDVSKVLNDIREASKKVRVRGSDCERLNSMTKEEMAAMILQMQRLNAQMQQTQLQLQQQVHTLTEKIVLMNARHFDRSTEKLETLPGQMNIFNEAEVAAAEAIAEPAIEQVAIRKKKQKDKEDLSRLPKRIEKHELTKEQLKEIFGENGWKRLPTKFTAVWNTSLPSGKWWSIMWPFMPQRGPMWTPSSGPTFPWICCATALPRPLWWPPS